jgi:hypothetical protein
LFICFKMACHICEAAFIYRIRKQTFPSWKLHCHLEHFCLYANYVMSKSYTTMSWIRWIYLYRYSNNIMLIWSRDSSVGIPITYWLDDRGVGVRVRVESTIFSFPRRPDRLWDSLNFLSNGYRNSFPRVKAAGS